MRKTEMFPFSLDLQLFAEGEPAGDAQSADGTTDAGASADNPILEELARRSGENMNVEGDQASAAEIAVQTPPNFEEVMKKHGLTFKDPEAFVESHKSLQADYTRKAQEAKWNAEAKERQRAEFNAVLANMQSQMQPQATEENVADAKETIFNDPGLLDKFYEKPAEVLREITNLIAEQKISEAVGPLLARQEQLEAERAEARLASEINQAVENFSAAHSDYAQYETAMGEFISALPDAIGQEKSFAELMEFAYEHVRGQEALKKASEPGLEAKLEDAEFVKHLADNPLVRDAVLQAHLAGVVKTTEDIPPILGSKSGGTLPAAEPRQFRTFEDSKKSFLSALGAQ